MRSDDEARAEATSPREAARLAFRNEISDAISGIIDRDHFLHRLARRVAEVTGTNGVAIYTRASAGGDFMLRSSTVPKTARVPPRVSADVQLSTSEVAGSSDDEANREVISIPISGTTEPMGALMLYSSAGMRFGEHDQQVFADIAEEIAPAIAVAEHHHAVKQASVIDLATGAYASWYFNQRFDEEIARSQRTHSPVTVVLVSVLHFEDAQRVMGYERSDALLRELTTEYSGLTRVFDIVGLRSRSEFSLLLPDTDVGSAAPVIARVHQRSAKVLERYGKELSGIPIQVVTGAASFPVDGDRVPTITLAAEHRLSENETLHRRLVETA